MPRADLHNHILFGLDDGAREPEDSLEMARIFVDNGYDVVAATPHLQPGRWTDRVTALARLDEVRALLAEHEVKLEIARGAEHYMDSNLPMQVDDGTWLPYAGDETRYALMEFPNEGMPPMLERYMHALRVKGVKPVLAHVERYGELNSSRGLELIDRLIGTGVVMQLNLGSLVGLYGWSVKWFAKKLLRKNMIHIVSSDMHMPTYWGERLPRALRDLEKLVGSDRARVLTEENPHRILKGYGVGLPPS